jgi:hypothetical protein
MKVIHCKRTQDQARPQEELRSPSPATDKEQEQGKVQPSNEGATLPRER